MRGVVVAGGLGSRMGIISRAINKHCNLVYKLPMIMYPLRNLRACGISEVLIVTSEVSAGQFIQILGNGEEFDLNLTYTFQKSANGIADALRLGRDFARGEPIVSILGDNFYHPHPVDMVKSWDGVGAKIILYPTDTPQEFGVVGTDVPYACRSDGTVVLFVAERFGGIWDGDKVLSSIEWDTVHEFFSEHPIQAIIEKPKEYIGNLMVTGIYMYDNQVWDIIDSLDQSPRGEYEITDVNTAYLERGLLQYSVYSGKCLDCGSPDKLLEASNYVKVNMELPDYGYHSK